MFSSHCMENLEVCILVVILHHFTKKGVKLFVTLFLPDEVYFHIKTMNDKMYQHPTFFVNLHLMHALKCTTKYGSLSMPSLRNLNLMKAWDHSNTKVAAKIVQDWNVVLNVSLSKVPFIDYVPSFSVDPVASLINMVPHSFRWQILRCWRLSRLAPQMLRNFGKSQSQIVFLRIWFNPNKNWKFAYLT